MTSIMGVDDAGRGPVIGPLVICGVLLNSEKSWAIDDLHLRDSKLLSPLRRSALYKEIIRVVDAYEIMQVQPKTIDEYVNRQMKFHGLNLLEAEVMARIIEKLKPEIAYVDASDVDAKRFGQWILERLSSHVEIISEHHADKKYPIVAAGSILAKVTRDREITKLRSIYGDFGSGYPADPQTRSFLKKYYVREGKFPPFTRQSWKTLDNIIKEVNQKKLF
ncbi:ribonuclease HII [[Eubacterium] cellulosolvens]